MRKRVPVAFVNKPNGRSQRMINDKLERILEATSIEEVWGAHTATMESYGFDRLLYGFTRYRTARSFGDLQDILTLSNHPKEYLERYLGGTLYLHGPMVRWLSQNVGACSWRWIDEQRVAGKLSEREIEVHEINKSMGLVGGYSISFKDVSDRAKGAIALTARPGLSQDDVEEIWKRDGSDIVTINKVMHLKVTQLPYAGLRRPLTKRQIEVLEWVADGKTTADAATIMGLTNATIEKHLRLARDVLDVDTTAQAVMKAAVLNQIFVHHTAKPS